MTSIMVCDFYLEEKQNCTKGIFIKVNNCTMNCHNYNG